MSIFKIFIGMKYIITKRRNTIVNNLFNGFILILKSSKKPTKKLDFTFLYFFFTFPKFSLFLLLLFLNSFILIILVYVFFLNEPNL